MNHLLPTTLLMCCCDESRAIVGRSVCRRTPPATATRASPSSSTPPPRTRGARRPQWTDSRLRGGAPARPPVPAGAGGHSKLCMSLPLLLRCCAAPLCCCVRPQQAFSESDSVASTRKSMSQALKGEPTEGG